MKENELANSAVPTSLTALLAAMRDHDADRAGEYLTDDIVLKSPIFAEPFTGRGNATALIGHLVNAVDEFESTGVLGGSETFAVTLKLRVGDTEVEGVDIVHVNAEGKIDAMTVQWRPLPAIVAVQNRLAPAVGVPALTLTELS
ncbi:nuclear transport factor 2 family protein [Mycobacterium sp. 21AC1]|uniref:nuclear transport factor 2 family protein n=1 Tax=[Mycobacterium] appelbergii TaxID=2939269 RepID=UPI00293915DB|nr:nuclear transport factor 2 family protein [Mycobacterium sp. 21AC1]MDV3123440.1 nuclear transport factor 2 family protein [Mycobacterium sp. 21AC1]